MLFILYHCKGTSYFFYGPFLPLYGVTMWRIGKVFGVWEIIRCGISEGYYEMCFIFKNFNLEKSKSICIVYVYRRNNIESSSFCSESYTYNILDNMIRIVRKLLNKQKQNYLHSLKLIIDWILIGQDGENESAITCLLYFLEKMIKQCTFVFYKNVKSRCWISLY